MLTGITLALSACSSTNPQTIHSVPVANISHIQQPALTQGHSVVYLIRSKEAVSGPTVNVFIDGHFATSLIPGSHRALSLCSHLTNITAAFSDKVGNYAKDRYRHYPVDLKENQTYYLSVETKAHNVLQLHPLDEKDAIALLKQTKETTDTLSRVPNAPCVQPSQPPIIKKYTISTNALFEFSKSDDKHLKAQGKKQLQEIAQEIKSTENQIGFIAVLGHTDPIGSDEFNRQLSQKRAETVRTLLIQYGLARKDIIAEGRGKDELIVTDCSQRFENNSEVLNECNQPNRRVEVITYGLDVK